MKLQRKGKTDSAPGLCATRARTSVPALLLAMLVLLAVPASSCGGPEAAGDTTTTGASGSVEIVVSAASDLAPVLEELTPLLEEDTGLVLKTNLGSTGQLMEQIAAGAGVDVFLAASVSAIDQLAEKDLLVPGSSHTYARGRLVMWTPDGSSVTIDSVENLADATVERISIANPDHAPYGIAARQALESAGLWDRLQPKLVPAENVRQAYQFAESGNVDVGLVALSLVITSPGTYTLVPENLHEPIDQALAIIASSAHREEAGQFVAFLTGEKGRQVLEKYGFVLPEAE